MIVILGIAKGYLFAPSLQARGEIVAYRGGGSHVDYERLSFTWCTAKSLEKSSISTVENTLQAVDASVQAGAQVIHLNVHRTRDGKLIVFHDWTLDCATDAAGAISERSYDELNDIDAGFGYSFDYGETFPFRGKGYRISSLEDFYDRYPKHEFWLNIKADNPDALNALEAFLSEKPRKTLIITSSRGMSWFRNKDSKIEVATVDTVKVCGISYLLMGWAGFVPESCKNTVLLIPPSKAKYFWGYPELLASRMQQHGSRVYLWARHEPIDHAYTELIESGVGVVTGDIDFIREANAHKKINSSVRE